jgi:UDP-N-acetylmuramoylalanine--D-glutamate ligase
MVALDAFDCGRILIAGGYDKGIAFDALARDIVRQAKAVVLMGQTGPSLAQAIRACNSNYSKVFFEKTLKDAVRKASRLAGSGDVVLLSPACASYDMFNNFQDRGDQFRQCVLELIETSTG